MTGGNGAPPKKSEMAGGTDASGRRSFRSRFCYGVIAWFWALFGLSVFGAIVGPFCVRVVVMLGDWSWHIFG